MTAQNTDCIAFIGGGNMATALIGGLVKAGHDPASILVVDPLASQRDTLKDRFGLLPFAAAEAGLARASTVVWAVKPQFFAEAAAPCAPFVGAALQVSVMAGIRSESIALATGSQSVIRAMPNTPALIGQGIAGMYARPTVGAAARTEVADLFAPTGQVLWVEEEDALDAVTALSGSGPAYVFYFLEAMVLAGTEMGLSAEQSRQLAQATFAGAAALAMQSPLSPAALREQVTSKGGTTHAAITALQAAGVKAAFIAAMHAAHKRAQALGGS